MKGGTLAVIIVSYNTREHTLECLRRLEKNTRLPHRVIIIDNASRDGSQTLLKGWSRKRRGRVIFIQNKDNKGFARACNQGLELVDAGEYVCLLNSDLMVPSGWALRLRDHFSDTDRVGAVGPLGRGIGGFQNYTSFYPAPGYPVQDFPPGPAFDRFAARVYVQQQGWFRTVKYLMGCCLLISPRALKQVGGLDEAYFCGADDFDWSVRARLQGFDLVAAHDLYVWHQIGASTSKEEPETLEKYRHQGWNHFNHKWKHVFPDHSWEQHFVSEVELDTPRFRLHYRHH